MDGEKSEARGWDEAILYIHLRHLLQQDRYGGDPAGAKGQHSDVTLCMDLMYVNGMPMFTSIDKTIRYRSVVSMENRTSAELYSTLEKVFRLYNRADFTITTIRCDQEFKHLMDKVSDDLDIKMNYTATDEHVPEAEQNNRTIGERIRAAYHNLSYKKIPKVDAAISCNDFSAAVEYFPRKGRSVGIL